MTDERIIEKLNNYGIGFIIGGIVLGVLVFIGGIIIANELEDSIGYGGNTFIMTFIPYLLASIGCVVYGLLMDLFFEWMSSVLIHLKKIK